MGAAEDWREPKFATDGLPGSTARARRDDMNQAGAGYRQMPALLLLPHRMVAAHGKYVGDDVFLANVLLDNVFDGDASRTGQFGSAITKRFGKSRIVEDPDLPRRKKPQSSPSRSRPKAACR